MVSSIKPFKISIPDSALRTLQGKLAVSSFPDEVDFSDNWSYGTTLTDIKRLARYWQSGFDWRAREKMLNEKLPQFTTKVEVDGFGELEMHFVHQRGEEGGIPLLFCHGWPGSFLEVLKILPLLTEKKGTGPSFHVVAPSLPNFGFSEGPKQPGFGIPQYAEAIHKVMMDLGYDKYVTQGGDWGFEITRFVALKYPTHCLATHLNFIEVPPEVLSSLIASTASPIPLEKEGLERTKWFLDEGYGYNDLQRTCPSTLGFGLRDPLFLLSWIYEKLHDWTDSYPWTDDEILTWISIYQFSRAGPEASVRIYYERNHIHLEETMRVHEFNADVKLGYSLFPKDLCVPPDNFVKRLGEVVFGRRHKSGGHFAAYERPEWLVEDLKEMFDEKGGAQDIGKKISC
ncbi:Alpha/Beta hydrolase protein [Tricladium varicosporioides]|nr:Alpha/Beta hydrolase protein [Hymenoscyphus varicosporioides]